MLSILSAALSLGLAGDPFGWFVFATLAVLPAAYLLGCLICCAIRWSL